MNIPIYQLDAFADKVFSGNPAAVCVLETWLPPVTMQSIAAENNLSETAFIVREEGHYAIRWFTPSTEIELCGHGTLASAYVVFHELEPDLQEVKFQSQSGELIVTREEEYLTLNFPARHVELCRPSEALIKGLNVTPKEIYRSPTAYVAILENESQVQELRLDFKALANLDLTRVIVSAPSTQFDFVSRYFIPRESRREDPVTGAAHCVLTPYWAKKLGKQKLRARQLSVRGGNIICELKGERVLLSGKVVPYLKGTITLP